MGATGQLGNIKMPVLLYCFFMLFLLYSFIISFIICANRQMCLVHLLHELEQTLSDKSPIEG